MYTQRCDDIQKAMLHHGEVNPLNVHGLRRVDHCPPHFVRVCFDLHVEEKRITDWVWTNLHGRFYFGDFVTNDNGKKTMSKLLAFEHHSEASYFGLFIDTVNNREEIW